MVKFGEMESNDECGPGNGNGKSNDPFIDRSKVRILLCDNDSNSSLEVFGLLCKCSYQVTSVKSARQVIDALNAEGPNIDIILSEVDLPTKKGLKMLKYIMRDKELQRIPVIMMSTQDEVSLVVKCLRLGAADYLVKPLRTNELLNLWTHMWRRRQMLGLPEKNIVNYDFDVAASDPSDANTNSTTLFSDDTDDRSRKNINPELSTTVQLEDESNRATSEPMPGDSTDCQPDVPGINERQTGLFSPFPKKSELKIGECSAFFTYVKSNVVKNNPQGAVYVKSNVVKNNPQGAVDVQGNVPLPTRSEDKPQRPCEDVSNSMRYENGEACENNSYGEDFLRSSSFPDSTSMERSCTPPVSLEFMSNKSIDEGQSHVHMNSRNGPHFDVSGLASHPAYPYYMSGMMNQVMMTSSTHMYTHNLSDHSTSSVMSHYNHFPHCPSHVPGMVPPFPYYPYGMCVQGQLPTNQQMPLSGNQPCGEAQLNKVDRREAALIKFRQKRKERCFDKKIRYVNRKKLAERRPRVRGQFVRKVNGVTVDLNGDPSPVDLDEEDEDDDQDSSPEDDAP